MASFNSSKAAARVGHASVLRRLFTALEVMGDALGAMLATQFACMLPGWIHYGSFHSITSLHPGRAAVLVGILVPLLSKQDGAYRGSGSLLKIRETERALRASFFAWGLLIPLHFLVPDLISFPAIAFAFFCIPICEVFQKQTVLRMIKWLYGRGVGVQRVIVYGAGGTGRRLMSAIWSSPKLGWHPIVSVDDDPELAGQRLSGLGYRRAEVGTVVPGPITPSFLREYRCDLLIIAIPNLPQSKFEEVLGAAEEARVRVAVLSDRSMPIHDWMESVDIDGLFLMSVGKPRSGGIYDGFKRILDFCGATLLLALFAPFILVCAVVITLQSPGGAFFRQERIGKDGRPFRMWKFRTMYVDVPAYEVSPTSPTDARITPFGRFLRKTSFDELPQLMNVIAGHMSLVGPRPEMPFLVQQYNPFQWQRLQIVPGITGLWQLSADRKYLIHENIQYDMYYIRNRGFFMDLAVLFHTVFFAVRGI